MKHILLENQRHRCDYFASFWLRDMESDYWPITDFGADNFHEIVGSFFVHYHSSVRNVVFLMNLK
jgi:hypothetical protein